MSRFVEGQTAVLFLIASAGDASAQQSRQATWQLKYNKNGVTVYTRPVAGSPILEFLGTTTVDAPIAEAVTYFDQMENGKNWMHQCAECTVLERTEDTTTLYIRVDMPRIVSDRDVVIQRQKKVEPDGSVVYKVSALKGVVGAKKGHVRMPKWTGSWSFKPVSPNRTEIRIRNHSASGGSIPAFVANSVVVDIPKNSLAQLGGRIVQNSVARQNSARAR